MLQEIKVYVAIISDIYTNERIQVYLETDMEILLNRIEKYCIMNSIVDIKNLTRDEILEHYFYTNNNSDEKYEIFENYLEIEIK